MCMKAERDIMTKVRHPFVTSLVYAFQSDSKVYLVMDYHSGGELFSYLRKETLFTEEKARFYLAEMVLALAHLHSQGIVHRDLKPENILISAQGHIKLTDFGLAKQYREGDELLTVCGTDEYMAPEIILGKGYDGAVDWWSLGALAHEMMVGKPPFQSRSIRDLHTKILTAKLSLPKWLSPDAHALLKALLERNVTKRLGSGKSGMFATRGVEAIKTHPFFKSVDWNMLERLRIPAPFVPVHKHDADTSNFDKSVTQMAVTELHFDPAIDEDQNRLFVGFSFCGMSELQKSDLHRESTPPSPRQAATLSSE
ncbi:TPA: hypothetical protein N0F65_002884 [Lagenidium giganteum]|uniref:Uncharacterized protein n=1 Tax=Lagenidium giganteum TaxID=4803 RepID=A0AAV2Z7X0_9STRA|nr:TPA: hypothetical protein N0F65_002884 [Lagenidium giganteum]